MGWLDYHLHEFRLLDATERNVVSIGIPTDDDPTDRPVVPGWEVPLSKFFDQRNWHSPPAAHESTLRWAGDNFDPEAFDPAAVKFDDPKKRWKKAFGRQP